MVDAKPEFAGLYESSDAGESWQKVNSDPGLWGRGSDFAEVNAVHEKLKQANPSTIED